MLSGVNVQIRLDFPRPLTEEEIREVIENVDYGFDHYLISSHEIRDSVLHDERMDISYATVRIDFERDLDSDRASEVMTEMDYYFNHDLVTGYEIKDSDLSPVCEPEALGI